MHAYLLGGSQWDDILKQVDLKNEDLEGLVAALTKAAANDDYGPLARLIGDRLIDLAFKYDPNLKSLSSNEHWQNLAKEAFHWVLGDETNWEHAFLEALQAIDGRLGDLVDVFWFGKKLTPARAESVLSLLDDIFHWSDNACLKDLRDKLKKLLTTVDEEGGVDIDKLLDVLLMELKDLPADIQKRTPDPEGSTRTEVQH